MRSVGLFADRRDAEALAAVQRAAQKPLWTEYYADEVKAEWKIQEETFGSGSALPRLAFAAGLLLPQYSQLRTVSRVAVTKAVEAEQEGRAEEGLRIRKAVRKCGGLMRNQSVCVIGALVGNSICQTSLLRPGGAPVVPHSKGDSDEQIRVQRGREYSDYLKRIGHAERIPEAEEVTAAGMQAREITALAMRSSALDAPSRLTFSWVTGVLLLSTAFWMLALGGGAMLLTRHRRIRDGVGLPPSLRSAVALGLIAVCP